MADFPLSELEHLPYVDFKPDDGRKVLLQQPFFDGDWHIYLEVRSGTVGRLAGGEPVYGSYFSKAPADPNRDIELTLATLITQRLAYDGPLKKLPLLVNDIHNAAAVLEKYDLLTRAPGATTGAF